MTFTKKNILTTFSKERCGQAIIKMYTHNSITLSLAGGEKEDQLLLKDLDMEVRYNDLDFEFQNLMGGVTIAPSMVLPTTPPSMKFWNSKSRSL